MVFKTFLFNRIVRYTYPALYEKWASRNVPYIPASCYNKATHHAKLKALVSEKHSAMRCTIYRRTKIAGTYK